MQYQDSFGRPSRFGTVAPPQIPQFPSIDERPPRPAVNRAPDVPQLDIGTPGGLSQNLQAAGASRAYSLKQALQLNRQQQGALNNPGNYAANGRGAAADYLTAPFTGTPFASQQRQMNDAALQRYQGMTPLLETGQVYKNEDQRIKNQFAPGILGGQIEQAKANTGLTTARTASEIGGESRAQGKYGMEMQQAPARFDAEMAGEKAKTGLVGAQTRRADAETTAAERDYRTRIESQEQTIKAMQVQMDDLLRQLGIQKRPNGSGGETGMPWDISDQAKNAGVAGAATGIAAGLNANQRPNPAGTAPPMTPTPEQQPNQQQANAIRQQARSGQITREQAIAQLKAIGFSD